MPPDPPLDGPYRDGRVHVLTEKCATCIFRPGNLMFLAPGRVKGLVREAVDRDSAIVCHSTLDTPRRAICRGYWDGYARRVWTLRLAESLRVLAWEPPPAGHRAIRARRGRVRRRGVRRRAAPRLRPRPARRRRVRSVR